MTVVDASIWVSSLVADDVHRARSWHWIQEQVTLGNVLTIPTLAVVEIAGAVSRRTGNSELGHRAAAALLRVPGLRIVPLDVDLGNDAARLAATYGLRGADAVYVAVAYVLQVPLATLDMEQRNRASKVIAVLGPGEP